MRLFRRRPTAAERLARALVTSQRSLTAHRPGTRGAVLAALHAIPHVAHARLVAAPGTVVALLTLRWWAWLTLGLLHRRTLARAWAVLHREVIASADIAVGFETARGRIAP